MFEIMQVQAVALREGKPSVERAARGTPSESRIQIVRAPKEVGSFFDFVPLGFQLEAYVKKATRQEVVLRLQFLGREVEITVKNLLGIKFKPGQKVLLTLIDRNPYVLKLSLPLAESYKIFSQVRNFFKGPLPSVLGNFLNLPSLPEALKNSGLFYESRLVNFLLGREKKENLQKDIKYRLFSLVKGLGFDRPKYEFFVRPVGRFKTYVSLPFQKVNLWNFVRAYGAFYEISPTSIERLAEYIHLTKVRLKKKFPLLVRRKNIRELDRPVYFHHLEREPYANFLNRTVSYNLLKELVDFIQFLQGWSIVQNYSKVVIPFTYKGRKFFVGLYGGGPKRNISLLWEGGLVKLSYTVQNPWQGELLMVFKDEGTLERFRSHAEELKEELKKVYFTPTTIKFATAKNPEELFILDMADKEHSNFLKIYL